jgi:hypothetical protein
MSDRGAPVEVAEIARRVKRLAAVQRRRIATHTDAAGCRYGPDGVCTWIAYERRILVGLWRALEALGYEDPEIKH